MTEVAIRPEVKVTTREEKGLCVVKVTIGDKEGRIVEESGDSNQQVELHNTMVYQTNILEVHIVTNLVGMATIRHQEALTIHMRRHLSHNKVMIVFNKFKVMVIRINLVMCQELIQASF